MPGSGPAIDRRNLWTFGVGTTGRDMVYTLVSIYLVYFLSDVLRPPTAEFLWASSLILAARLFDAVADIVMGAVVDNTRSRWGHYKPWIAGGVVASALFTVLLFADLGLSGGWFVVGFALIYLFWSLSWTANDIPYWSLLPALTLDQTQRERFGAVSKIFATIGLFVVVVAVIPVTEALAGTFGTVRAWTVFAAALVVIMLASQSVTLFGVREPGFVVEQERTSVRELAKVVFGNDQLLWTAIAMVLFMTGYLTTTTFGTYYFKYVYGDEGMYSPFAAVLVASQLLGFAVFPALSKRFSRRWLYTMATVLILVGYVIFFFAPTHIAFIAVSGLLLFIGDAFITLLMLVFLTDTIEYGQWKLGRRNGAVTFALQPFINKVGAALSTQIVAVAIVIAGVNPDRPADTSASGLLTIKVGMLVVPPILVLVGYLIYRAKYRIDEDFYARIVADLKARGQLQ
ncbi:MAG: glycoside-pentoside-hexuronide (GPH):cation symporter [Propionicimonas sp.]|uniref:glycoside-pentoside-hexuronide (GPH):cation symporter n=1 Tax=Propionicimonas sp. TaxID=1955623 RepID=UPI003D10D476